ncbi:dicarboxylate/amino acid:cation symporter [Caulobacter sp. KR2-114]|uniref:dicarboxylate/amino acid:cation symporter n=1 Tax=Caulobacter sp. KR2-114 TaxID=3400912 RepID=UPI003C03496B
MRVFRSLYVQVLTAIVLGVAVGAAWPEIGKTLEPLGVGFVKLIKMLIAPIIFCTVTGGIAKMSDLKAVGRVGGRALIYFETVSTLALVIGLAVGELVRPGVGFNSAGFKADPASVATFVSQAKHLGVVDYLLHLIPDTFASAFAGGDILQVLLLAILTGFALAHLGPRGEVLSHGLERVGEAFFAMIGIVVRFAPVGAFGAMAFTIGKYGLGALQQLAALVATFYVTAILFVVVVLGLIARAVGFSIFRYLAYIKDELLIVLGASSSEAVLPQMMAKLQRLGAPAQVTGLVIPAGYSFNLDGTNIYMTLATLFLAQATGTHLTLGQELTILGVAMLTSKGASGITGAGFVTLIATLNVVPTIPVSSVMFLLGVDRFMSECRALTNVIGNGVATLVVARWEGALDVPRLRRVLAGKADVPEDVQGGEPATVS